MAINGGLVNDCDARLLLPLKIYAVPDTAFQCFLIGEPTNDKILKRQSNAAEDHDLVRVLCGLDAPRR